MEYEFAECWRLYDEKYLVKNTFNGTFKPLWIDIEPMVGFPDSKREIKRIFGEIIFYRTLLQSSAGSLWHGKTFFRKVVHMVLRPVGNLIGYDKIFKKLESIKNRYDFEEKEFVGNMCSPVGLWHGMVRKEVYTRAARLEFEGRMYSVPGNYLEYLEPLYGKNCTTELPPESVRVGHEGEIYRYVS